MTQAALLLEITGQSEIISAGTRAYLQQRLRNRIYNIVVTEYLNKKDKNPGFTKAALAKHIGARPEQVEGWLASPQDWTIDIIADLLIGIAGAELDLSISYIADKFARNLVEAEAELHLNPSANIHQPPSNLANLAPPSPRWLESQCRAKISKLMSAKPRRSA